MIMGISPLLKKAFINSPAHRVYRSFRSLWFDNGTWSNPTPLYMRIWRTFRYRAAGMDFPMTENEKKLCHFRNYHLGQRAFILGNGPSLNLCDLTLLRDEITFGVNNIFLNESKMGFKPTYYVVEDTLVAEDRSKEINSYHGPKKFFGNYLDYCIQGDENTIWLNVYIRYNDYPGFPHFSRNAARIIWTGGTVSYLCMQLAYYMGIQKVYLVGFDHNYQIPTSAKPVKGTVILSQDVDPNHFHPEYFGKGYRWNDPRTDRMEIAYRKARSIWETDDRKIYNATIGGKLDVFERVDYESLF